MSEPLAFLHGRFLPQSRAHLALHDAGFVMGATVTDLTRTFRHRLFRWEDHLARFRDSCAFACIDAPLEDAAITNHAQELVAHNARVLRPGQDLALVMFATPGPVGYYLGEPGGAGDGPATFGMHTFPLPLARYQPLFQRGAHLAVPSIRAIPPGSMEPRIKQRSRLHWWLAERELKRSYPGALALLMDEHGRLTETAAANLLIVKEGVIKTPHPSLALPGISLKVLREMSHQLRMPWQEAYLTLDDALDADEAMISSTPFCMAGVSRLQGKDMPWPGALSRRLQEAWSQMLGIDFVKQVLAGS